MSQTDTRVAVLTDAQYHEILEPVLSRYGMQRYLNGDEITLNPSDYRTIIDRAYAASAQSARVDEVSVDPAIGTPEGLRNYAKGYAAGRKKARAEAARQPARALPVKSWRERVSSQWLDKMARDGIDPGESAMLAEIADLRTILASTQKGV